MTNRSFTTPMSTNETVPFDPDSVIEFTPAFVPVQVDENTLHVRGGPWSGPAITVRDTDDDRLLGRLLDLIDGETTVTALYEAFGEKNRDEIESLLAGFAENDIIREVDEGSDTWAHLALKYRFQHTERERLGDRSVLIVACDRMGQAIATDLLEMGIGSIEFTQRHGPTPQINDDRIHYHDDPALTRLIERADVVVYTADRPRPLVNDLNELALLTETPLVPVQIHGFDGIVGPTVYPDETACYHCFEERTRSNVIGTEGYDAYRSSLDSDEQLSTATLPAFSRLVAGFAAMELVHHLAYGTGYTAGRVVTIDSLELSMEANDVLALPRCACCGVEPGKDVQRFVSMDDIVHASELNEAGRPEQTDGHAGTEMSENRSASEAVTDEVEAE